MFFLLPEIEIKCILNKLAYPFINFSLFFNFFIHCVYFACLL